ncbi:hypothetical protein [Brevibacillus sp. SYSU BS000544]|uniref:hypothetical protein n=1 Tax=Brevibacillus sp. SYSU BS000544 TaxID=3416443 RepID=UPI003CE5B2F1
MIFCTVSTYKHLGLAIIMAKSIRNTQPEARIVLCLVEEEMSMVEPYRWLFDDIVLAKQLGIRNFYRHMFRHTEIEGPCSCKARLLLYALQRFPYADKFVYIDSDMKAYGPFTELSTTLDHYPIVLTPHNFVAKKAVVRHGYFNAGFLAFRRGPKARKFLQWWARKLDQFCYLNVQRGLNADQKWLDQVPRLFGAHVFFHPGYNVGPWNVGERTITHTEDGSWLANGEPLKVFHFSSVLRFPNFSSYLVHYTSHVIHTPPRIQNYLTHLIKGYFAEVEMHLADLPNPPWSYGHFANGRKILVRSRLNFRRNRHKRYKFVKNPFQKSNLFFRSQPQKRKRLRKRR